MASKYWWRDDEKETDQQDTSKTTQTANKTGNKYWWRDEENTTAGVSGQNQQSSGGKYWWRADDASTAAENITNRVKTWLENHNNYITNFQTRNSGRKYNYEDSYVSDSADWLDTISKQKSSFDAEADAILSYMDQYTDYLDAEWVEKVRNTLTSERNNQQTILDAATKDNEWWSNFKTEDDYKTYQRYDGYSQKYNGMSSEDIMNTIDTLEDGEEKDWLTFNQYGMYKGDQKYNITANSGWQSYVAQKEAKQAEEDSKSWFEKAIESFATSPADTSLPNAGLINAQAAYQNDTSYREPNDKWSKEERRHFGYLWATDKNKAYEYAEQVNNAINSKEKYTQMQAIQKAATESGWGMLGNTLASIATAPFALGDYLDDLVEYSTRGTITQKPGVTPFEYSQTATGAIANKLNEGGKINENIPIIGGKGWGDVYSLGVSTANSLLSAYALGGTGTLINFIGQGGASGVDDALSRGATAEQALLYGTIVGAAEGITEMIPAEELLKVGSSSTIKNFLKKSLKQGIGEFAEEGTSAIIGEVADRIIMADKSNFNATVEEYMNGGMSKEEAEKKAWGDLVGDVLYDAMGGFVSGFGSASITGGVNTVIDNSKSNQKNIDAIKQYGDKTDVLIQEGLESDVKSDSYQLAQKYQKKTNSGKTLTGTQIRNLLAANQEQITPKDLKLIQKAAEERLTTLGQTKDVSKVAELATKWATGQKLSKSEKNFLTTSEYGSRVANELHPKNILEGNFSSEWAEDIGTRKVNATAYNKKAIRSLIDAMANTEDSATYKPLEDRVENIYTTSETGEATIHESGEAISMDDVTVASIGADGMTLRVDGKEVSTDEIDFADDSQSYLYSAVSKIENITPGAATAIIRGYDSSSGQTVGEYLNGIDEAYTYGYHGYSEADLKAGQFATKLTNEQATTAYELGKYVKEVRGASKADAIKKMRTAVEAETAKAVSVGKEAPSPKKMTITYNEGNGKVVDFDNASVRGRLTTKQKAAPALAQVMHEMGLGTNFELFSSYLSKTLKDKDGNPVRVFLDENGVEQKAYSGVYRKKDGTIRIDLNAYNGRKLTLDAMSHELTHFIQQWSTEKYEVLADFLVKTYEKTDMTMHERVLREQARLKRVRGEEVSYSEAYDEVVANAMSKMLSDSKVMEKLTELQNKDADLAHKLWQGLKKLLNKFFRIYENESALFYDAADLMDMKAEFEQMKQMWAEAFVEASENFQASLVAAEVGVETVAVEDVSQYSYSSLAEAAGFEAVENDDGTRSFTRDGNKVNKVTVDDIDNSPIGAFINFSLEMGDINDAEAMRQKQMFADICTMACKTNDFAMTMQFVGSAVFTGMKANADKQYGTTYDFPSICTKTQAVIDAMSAKMVKLGRGLNTNEIVQLYDDVFASGNPVPCPECYVFSRWIGIGGLLDNIKKYQDYYGDMDVKDVATAYLKMKAEVSKFADEQGISFGKAKGALTSKLTKEYNKLNEKIEKAQNQGEKVKPADQKRLAELEPMMNTVKSMTWLENVYFADSSLKKVNPNFRVPDSVLFDLNNGEAFATKYKDAWAFRTTQGAGYGKAITPYAEARLGEGVLVTNNTTNAIKGKAQGTLDNFFLQQMGKLDKKSRDALKRARLKQKIQAFIGGQRFQSTSDARYENASDYLLAALEMQAMAGMVQCYTKVDGAVPAFSAWGFSINQSLMPLNGGLDADGNVKDTSVGGMKPSVAFENRNKHESAGTITIGVNDNHIRAMFKQLVRDFIIPYHASGGKADVVAEFRRIQEGKEAKGKAVRSTDYSRTQSDKVLSDEVLRWQGKTDAQIQRIHEIRDTRIAILTGGKVNMTVVRSNRFLSALYDKLNGGEWDGVKLAKSKVESQIFPNEFWDQTVTYDESAKITKDYLEYCEDLGFLHRFSGMVPSNGKLVPVNGYNENGERVQLTDLAYQYDENGNKTDKVEDFFWKVLTDRRMYDNNGNYLAQKVVTLNDTTTETVTGFAKNNQGREYDKAKAEALAKKIVGEQYSSQETDIDNFDIADYPSIKLSGAEQRRLEKEAMTWNANKVGRVLHQTLSNNYTYVYYFDKEHNITVLNKFKATNIHERHGVVDDKQNRRKIDRNDGRSGSERRIDSPAVFGTDRGTASNSNRTPGKAQSETRTSDRRGYAEGTSDTDKTGAKELKSSQETDLDVGYHAGDLGKSESLWQQGLGRDTGHFGTGTYFVGNKAAIDGYNSRGGKPAPVESVNFDKYNLFKPNNADDGLTLHDFLRGVDGYWDRDADAVNTMEEYEGLQEKLSDLVYDIESNEFGETDPSDESWLAVEREFLYNAKRMMGDYKVGKELTDTLNRLVDGNFQYDPKNREYYSFDFDTDQFTDYTEDEIIQKLNSEDGGWRAFEDIVKLADDYYSYSRTSRYETWSESIKDVAEILGMSEQEVRNVIQSVTEDINSRGYTDADKQTADSAATRFMKALGYEGIDVRGIKGLDNTSYGSVIYDLKGEDLTRKEAIGTARYSGHDTDNVSNRSLLANAFEGIVQNSDEYKLIEEYKGRIKILNEYEAKLDKLNSEIRDIRFGTTGPRDMARLRQLETEAKNIAQSINRQDKKLLSLEASEPLRKVIERERKKEAKKTVEHIKEIQQNKKDRAEQTELRHKIRKAVRDLDKLLNRGNKKQNVKEDMRGFVSKALDLADYLFTDHISNDDLIRKGIDADLVTASGKAQLVKETEDILTKIYDEADSLTDEEFTRLDTKRKSNEEKMKDLLTAQRNRRLDVPVYNLFNDLVIEYASLKNSNQDAVKAAYNDEVERLLRTFIGDADSDRAKTLQNMRVADMTTEELWKLYNAYTMVLTTVRDANKFHVKGMAESIEHVVGQIAGEFSSRKIPEKKLAIAAQKIANKIGWDYEKLYYALDRIGSDAFTKLIMNLADSENIVMRDVIEAMDFRDQIVEKYGFNNWAVNKEIDREFMDNSGKKFKMTLGQMMSLYAYSRREGAWDHIEYGGFVFGEAALTNPKPADSYKLSKAQCEAITSLLTKEQKGYVEDMQKFLSETMGAKGNEVSMQLYGIKMFGEKNYFPIHIAGQFKAQANESQAKAAAGFQSMSNAGFTHAQNPNAKAPFVLEGFNEIWSDHVNEMSRYHGTVPALEDIRRVMNRSTYSDSVAESQSIKQLMENHYGKEAVDYFDNIYREANSGAITDKLQRDAKKLLSLFRKNSVAYSLSVIIQQPAAMVRAYAMIDRKYFGFNGVGALTSGVAKAVSDKWTKAHTDAYNEMLKYAPGVTMAKEIGGFDTATGGSIRSTLLDTKKSLKQKWKNGTVKEKGKAILDVVDDNAIANLPNVADKIAWIEIWNACKKETLAKHKNLAPTSEEFMQIVGDRFTEVIRATQVYDSIFAKSPMLKSKNIGVQMLVSFMNEPNAVANMVESAVRDVTRGDWKKGAKTAAVVVHSIIFTNVLKSIVYAMRDDDEDETYIEKYIEAIAGNMMDDFNALNYIPIARDVWSLAQGYDVERADMAIVADAIGALNNVFKNIATQTDDMTEEQLAEFDKKVTETTWQLVESLAAFLGIPVKNIRREINGVIDHARIASANAGMTTENSAWDAINKAIIDSIPFMNAKESKIEKLYDAIVSGDKTYVDRIKNTYKDEDAYESAVRKALRENDPRIKEAAQARYDGNTDEYKRIFREIQNEGKFSFDDIMSAINSEENAIKNKLEPDKVTSAYSAGDFIDAVIVGNASSAQAIRDELISTYVANGKTQEEAEEAFVSSVKTSTHDAYSSGLLDDAGAENMLVEYADMGEEDAASRVNYWAFCNENPEYANDITESKYNKYKEFAEPVEISLDVFVQYINGTKGLETIKDEWGDIDVSKREQVLEVIDSLPLTWEQKDALYLAHGYAESKIWDVPW